MTAAGAVADPFTGISLLEKSRFLQAVISVAAADDAIGVEELERIRSLARRLRCRLKAADLRTFSLEKIATELRTPLLRQICLGEMIAMAHADRKLTPDEEGVIRYLAAEWELSLPSEHGIRWGQGDTDAVARLVAAPTAVAPDADDPGGRRRYAEQATTRIRRHVLANERTLTAVRPGGLQVGWITIGSGIMFGLSLLAGVVTGKGSSREAALFVSAIIFFAGGLVVGLLSPRRTLHEPAIAAALVTLFFFLLAGRGEEIPLLSLVPALGIPFILAFGGAWLGELVRDARAGAGAR